MQTPHQPSTGSTDTWLMLTRRFQPYETYHARSNDHRNAEAGPSTLAPPSVSYPAPPATYPSGGSPEAAADAEKTHQITEDDTAPVSNFYCSHIPHVTGGSFRRQTTKRPRGTGKPRNWRIQHQKDARKLCLWAQGWKSLRKLPTQTRALDSE